MIGQDVTARQLGQLRPVAPADLLTPARPFVVAAWSDCASGASAAAVQAAADLLRVVGGRKLAWEAPPGTCNVMQGFVAAIPIRAATVAEAALQAAAGAARGEVGIFERAAGEEPARPTLADVVRALQAAKATHDRVQALRRPLPARARRLHREWAASTKALMKLLADFVEGFLPAALGPVAGALGVSGADVLQSLRIADPTTPTGLASPAVSPWVIVGVLAVVAVALWVTVPIGIEALRVITTHGLQTLCLDRVLDAVERGAPVGPVVDALPDLCRPPTAIPWWVFAGGAVLVVGGGYLILRRRRAAPRATDETYQRRR